MYQPKLDKDIRCPLEYGLELFGGKWNSRIICVLAENGPLRHHDPGECARAPAALPGRPRGLSRSVENTPFSFTLVELHGNALISDTPSVRIYRVGEPIRDTRSRARVRRA